MNRHQTAIVVLSVLTLVSLAVFAIATNQQLATSAERPPVEHQTLNSFNRQPFATLDLKAKSAIVYDPANKETIFALEAQRQLPIASLTKVMTTLVAAEILPRDKTVNLAGERWRFDDLADYTLVVSSNQGAESIAAAAGLLGGKNFVSLMNERARQIGLNNTFFINPTGLDLTLSVGGSYSTAEDVATLLSHTLAQHPEILEATRHENWQAETLDRRLVIARNTNEVVGILPGLLGSKTGFTDVANGNLGIVFDRGLNQPIVIVVLGSDSSGRFSDVKQLVEATLTAYGTEHN